MSRSTKLNSEYDKFFESDGWKELNYAWTKYFRTDYVLLIMHINILMDKFAASFHFFEHTGQCWVRNKSKKKLFDYTLDLQSFEVGLVSCLSKIKSDTMRTTLSDETKVTAESEIDRIIESYILFSIHEV